MEAEGVEMKQPRKGRVIQMPQVIEPGLIHQDQAEVKPIRPTVFMFQKEENKDLFVQDLMEGASHQEDFKNLNELLSHLEKAKPFKKR
jgi:hypothetical protein